MALKKCELLAPAGSIDALKAAVYAGADAVYFGGGSFNARAFAKNFNDEELKTAFDICRSFGIKAYIVLNTVLTDWEIPKALEFVAKLESNYKPNAYIVQDIGLITKLKKTYPNIPLHASTQMQLHSSHSASKAKKLGLERIVFARELSKEDIKKASSCGLETEIFVHGAVCVCQSGGCLMSSFIGGRSGNRGRCAQPCRQSYNGAYPLSLKDMCYASHIPEICAMGVDCLKIEGRMKSPEYVYETVSVYRTLLDECRAATNAELNRLSAAFSRSGFSDGYYVGKKNKAMFGIRTETDKEISRSKNVVIRERKIPVSLFAEFRAGEEVFVRASAAGYTAQIYGQKPFEAINQPLSKESLSARLCKTGDTLFSVAQCEVILDDGIMLPISVINALRRDVLNKLQCAIIDGNTPKRSIDAKSVADETDSTPFSGKPLCVARFDGQMPSKAVLNEALRVCDRVDLPIWHKLPPDVDVSKISLILPRTVFDSDTDNIKKLIVGAKERGINQLTVPNIGMLSLCEGFILHGDYTLNVTNADSAKALIKLGFNSVTVSPEVVPDAIVKSVGTAEYTVYGKAPLMHTETCIISNITTCKKDGVCTAALKDKTGAVFPIMREYKHRNIIYNSVPTYLLDKTEKLNGVSAFVLYFTNESDNEVLSVLEARNNGAAYNAPFTRAAFKRGKEVF